MSDLAAVRLLLQQTEKLLEIRREQLRRSGGGFNVFSVLEIETREVQTHNHLLYELLNPGGSHGMGDRFLREFFRLVIDEDYPDTPVQVFREYSCSAGKIDLLLLGKDLCYPFEIKIHAPDQELQVRRYADFAASRAGNNLVFYLTLDGHEPSEYSTGGDNSLNYTTRDFSCDVRAWLVECGKIAWKVPAVSEIIRQYIQLIDKLTNRMEDVYMDMIQNMVGASRASYESAMAIANAVTSAKADLLRRIFSGIESHIGDRMELKWSDYQDRSDLYCNRPQARNAPYLTYCLAAFDSLNLYFEILIDWHLYYRICFMDQNGNCDSYSTNRLPRMLPDLACKEFIASLENDGGVRWKFLPDMAEELLPDFHSCNSPCLNLFDAPQFDAWMQRVCLEIDACIEKMQEIGLLGYEGHIPRQKIVKKARRQHSTAK